MSASAAGDAPRTVQVIYGLLPNRISVADAERFITLHAFERGISVPQSPLAMFWCRRSPPEVRQGDAARKWMVGWTAPVLEQPPEPTTPQLVALK